MTGDGPDQTGDLPEETIEAVDAAKAPLESSVPDDPVLAELAAASPGAAFEQFAPRGGPPQDIVRLARDDYHSFVAAAHAAGFDVFADLCGVDYLRRHPRFDVVLNVLSHRLRARLRIHVGVTGDDPTVPSVTDVYPGANFYERETYDLFGIVFVGHPDLTRILLPDDWEGHPLRKDYAVGSVPVQFKEAHKAP